jgi:hypothetical protein
VAKFWAPPATVAAALALLWLPPPDGFQKDGLVALIANKLEENAQLITGAARPGVFELSAKFVGF